MRCLQQSTKLLGSDQGDILSTAALDDHNLTVGCDFVSERGQVRAGTGIGRSDWHVESPG